MTWNLLTTGSVQEDGTGSNVASQVTTINIAGVGNLIVVPFTKSGTALPTIADSRGNTWSRVANVWAGGSAAAGLFWCIANAAGSDTITVSYAPSSPYVWTQSFEYSGNDQSSPFDASTHFESATLTDPLNGNPVTTSRDNSLIIVIGGSFGGAHTLSGRDIYSVIGTPGAVVSTVVEAGVAGPAGSYTPSFHSTVTGAQQCAVDAFAFKPPSAVVAQVNHPTYVKLDSDGRNKVLLDSDGRSHVAVDPTTTKVLIEGVAD